MEIAVLALGLARQVFLPDFLFDAVEGADLLQGVGHPLGFVGFGLDELSTAMAPALGVD
ncbi:MAG: hypothetical protein RE468_12165 [Acidithiobacillus caldus]|nr:hypothetical protein [Acidithiobacillus caldus]WMT46629.1 MAG: hypothetical protein RE468_12165 [Acidithiobacillus caldus]